MNIKFKAILVIGILIVAGISIFLVLRDKLPPYEKIVMNRFPISLEKIFRMDNETRRWEMINHTRDYIYSGDFFIIPYPNYYHFNHMPAVFKWYITMDERLPISLPMDTYMDFQNYWEESEEIVLNGSEMITQARVHFYLNYYITLEMNHITINKSLADQYATSKIKIYGNRYGIYVPANITIGYTTNNTIDIRILDSKHENFNTDFYGASGSVWIHAANPFWYFSENVQNTILVYSDDQYNAAKQSGLYPFATYNLTFDINEQGTFFGAWFYKEGNFVLNETHHTYDWYSFDGGILDIINVNKTNNETFYKDWNTGENFTGDMIGLFGDADYFDVAGYHYIGPRYMYWIEGDFQAGIINITATYDTNLSMRPGQIYLKYELDEQSAGTIYDDLLQVEYFDNYMLAQGSFTANKFLFIRLWEN
ncbi:MAG TPA: hypothetical protein VMV49_11270 [Candidatus Deferrimicrobium sp.]|nr:hypothetical protein [Candidatus Deferrimicrobium sp.]